MKTGITYFQYARHYETEKAVEYLRADGFGAVDFSELWDTRTAYYTDRESEVEKRLCEIGEALRQGGIEVFQIHGPWRYPPQDETAGKRAEWLDLMKRGVRMATYVGSKNMVVHPLMPYGANSPENPAAVIDASLEHYARLADYAKDYGVTVCLENMPFPLLPLGNVDQVVELVDALNRRNLGVCLDTGHANVCGTPLDMAVKMVGKRLVCLHVHDNDGKEDQHLAPLSGTANFAPFARALSEIGFGGSVSSEVKFDKDLGKREFRAEAKRVGKILRAIAENTLK